MKLTPIDVQQQEFGKAFRGYDCREVESFLELVATRLADVSRENRDLRDELRRLERELADHRDREETLREAMLTAQRAIDEIREQAKKEAQLVVSEAEIKAEKLLYNAQCRVTKLLDETVELKRQRRRAVEELRAVLSSHRKMLDAYDEEYDENEATVTVLGPVRAPSPPSMDAANDS